MRKSLMLPALAVIMAASLGSAYADDDDDKATAPRTQWLTVTQISEKFTSQGYDVLEVETDDGRYEIKAIDKSGKRVEIKADPVSGDIVKQELDD